MAQPGPMPKLLPPVLSALDLPAAELSAARLDGEMFCIGDGYASVDAADDATHRAFSFASGVPPRLVAERRTAAWIHGALTALPAVHEFCVDIEARYRAVGVGRHMTREVVFGDTDVVVIGTVRVTSYRRTAIDLLRQSGPLEQTDADAIVWLAQTGGFTLQSVHTELAARRHLPGKLAVAAKLEGLLAQPAETR